MGILERDKGYVYGGIILDHDLRMSAITAHDLDLSGNQVVNCIIRTISRDVPVPIYSMNPDKSPIMASRLEASGCWVSKTPWSEMTDDVYLEWLEIVKEEWDDLRDG